MTVPLCADLSLLREHVTAWRLEGKRIAVVPTMGALHVGHARMIEASRDLADRTIVTVFVNPKQFAPTEDFRAYPRHLDADCEAVAAAGGDLVYAPDVKQIYPPGFATLVVLGGPAKAGLEDQFRPAHFNGVATVVAKLLMRVQPDVALFGEKDFQQLRVIQRMVADLDLAVQVVPVPVVRDYDGLALSSRNAYLDPSERSRAPALHAALVEAAAAIARGTKIEPAVATARRSLDSAGFAIDYVEARRADNLTPLRDGEAKMGRLLAAARLGKTRLIDNVRIDNPRNLSNIVRAKR